VGLSPATRHAPVITRRPDDSVERRRTRPRLNLVLATLRRWERAGVLRPPRDSDTGHRIYRAPDIRDAQLAHLLRCGGYLLKHIATVLTELRCARPAALPESFRPRCRRIE
jgi:DNA-binding transcriptional MerR regulator